MKKKLFIGVTSWNSELFLDSCLSAIAQTTKGIATQIIVFDNCSDDNSNEIVREHGVKLVRKKMDQADALNYLLNASDAQYTLLIHADTILLSNSWFDLCVNLIDARTVLVSPEDIGCGPMTRSFGKGMPESSFLFFDTRAAKKLRHWRVTKRRFKIPYKIKKSFDFFGEHITHNIPMTITSAGKKWHAMQVLHSNVLSETIYEPKHYSKNWTDILGKLEYGLGNFYAIGNEITHYHNWYDRISGQAYDVSNPTTQSNNDGFEIDYIHQYSSRFIKDFNTGSVNIPKL